RYLRNKLGTGRFETVRGVGYRLSTKTRHRITASAPNRGASSTATTYWPVVRDSRPLPPDSISTYSPGEYQGQTTPDPTLLDRFQFSFRPRPCPVPGPSLRYPSNAIRRRWSHARRPSSSPVLPEHRSCVAPARAPEHPDRIPRPTPGQRIRDSAACAGEHLRSVVDVGALPWRRVVL